MRVRVAKARKSKRRTVRAVRRDKLDTCAQRRAFPSKRRVAAGGRAPALRWRGLLPRKACLSSSANFAWSADALARPHRTSAALVSADVRWLRRQRCLLSGIGRTALRLAMPHEVPHRAARPVPTRKRQHRPARGASRGLFPTSGSLAGKYPSTKLALIDSRKESGIAKSGRGAGKRGTKFIVRP